MPTLPPPGRPSGPSHQARDMAESFGVDAERYDRARPRYPDELVDRVAAGRTDVLDVGCGTGIVARQLADRGCRVLGVEPDARMADLARRHGVEVEEGRFEEWDPAGRTVDAVVAGQTWHWVDPVAGAQAAARVLRPGGLLAVFWNVEQPPEPLAEAFASVFARVLPGSFGSSVLPPVADPYAPLRATAADGMARAEAFGEPEHWHVEGSHTYTREAWLDLIPTQGGNTGLPADTLATLLAGLAEAIDAAGGEVPVRRTTTAVAATRR